MKPVESVFRKAAERVFESAGIHPGVYQHIPACVAIHQVFGTQLTSGAIPREETKQLIREGFKVVFKPYHLPETVIWFGGCWSRDQKTNEERLNHRVFALLFMAELAKDQGI